MDTILLQAVLLLLLPLAAFTILIFFGKRLPRQGDWLATGAITLSLLLALVILGRVFGAYDPNFRVAATVNWVDLGPVRLQLGLAVDNLTAVMLFVVTLISALVHLFSIGYMHGDVRYSRFFAYLGLFSFSMLGLVLVDNFFGIYMFWELVGVCSYFLIGHWFERDSAANAAKKAFIVNRVGDIGMFTGIMILLAQLGTLNFREVFDGIAQGRLLDPWLTAAGVLIFLGAVGKSAQFPLHVWLPDAMEGPTPVSALIHAATMVAAGVYMVGRVYPLFTEEALLVIAITGTLTAFIAATIALAQVDIKRVLAYSTVSQLGYMIAALGVGGYTAGLFHLMTHAYFKALLFLASGSVIHAMHQALHHLHDHHTDAQDMRNMGALRRKMPLTFSTMTIAACAIAGVPLLSGFFSKDAILAAALEKALTSHQPVHLLIFVILVLCAGLTAFYMFRLLYLTFAGQPARRDIHQHIQESPSVITIPLIILAFFSVVGGYGSWFADLIRKPETLTASRLLLEGGEGGQGVAHTAHTVAMSLSIFVAGAGILLATAFYYWKKFSADELVSRFKPVYDFLWNKWYFDELYAATVVAGTLLVSRLSAWFDATVIDGLVNAAAKITVWGSRLSGWHDNRIIDGVVNGVAAMVGWFGSTLRELQTGKIQTYILLALGAVVLLYVLQLAFA
ncbi:MAG: NADH-quinone oxidoreductase subunit L [candidate division KSB1 bacterium]|nr:NADH-quinone oxidoreductase subunit L [candidate division KSB1 bacterium]MDZ7274893.1 NADH-quinone oxidoreductase subunit L [candidate division KSB1 bacterium]MDZ7286655.1 NADH-quinone oxidoreductase subunit L [candidate division KSB1 bacterium]MDZ7299182.1 NADH-quinone oxidoreductase subunit L [candidate division KSB1 bacterium]MDZ7308510.1 NADH-quinone oxidoreductase subunit L [candidate division KSB1 bacterium]